MRALWQRLDVWAFVACALLFAVFPTLDLTVSGWLYDPASGFFLRNNPLVRASYVVFARMGGIVTVGLLGYWGWRRFVRRDETALWQRRVVFLLAVLAIGPGLLVNGVLKAYSGRARPAQVEMFGGDRAYSAAGVPARACERNCSFVSGHAATAFATIAFAWVFRSHWWLVGGIALGGLVGFGRMAQGGHFLSDVVFAFWVVYLATQISARWVLRQPRIEPAPP